MNPFCVICIYNDEELLEEWLLESVRRQESRWYETVLIDNTEGDYESAARALNEGAKGVDAEYYLFVHQDVRLLGDEWFEEVYEQLQSIPDLGVAGAAGMSIEANVLSERGRNVIYHGDEKRRWELGNKISEPTKVQTVDELLLIVPQAVFSTHRFDPKLCDGWHLYGVEYALRINYRTLNSAYVLPIDVYHRSDGGWGGVDYFRTLYDVAGQYRSEIDNIYTTKNTWSTNPMRIFIRIQLERLRRLL